MVGYSNYESSNVCQLLGLQVTSRIKTRVLQQKFMVSEYRNGDHETHETILSIKTTAESGLHIPHTGIIQEFFEGFQLSKFRNHMGLSSVVSKNGRPNV